MFVEINSSWLIFESIKASKIETSTLFNLVFTENTIFMFLFLVLTYWLIIFFRHLLANFAIELVIPKGMPANEAKTKIETEAITAEAKISTCSI